MLPATDIIGRLAADGALVEVHVASARGSTPREAGASMFVFRDGSFTGTIGGGTLEWLALVEAQKLFSSDKASSALEQALGPDLGQCCGGYVFLQFQKHDVQDSAGLLQKLLRNNSATDLLLFGAGHVGRALVLALAPLPFAVRWLDPRASAFPSHVPGNVTVESSLNVVAGLEDAAPDSFVAVMTHSHALDLAIVAAALPDPRFCYVGLIGSDTKRGRFISQMRQAGLRADAIDRLVCPIGIKEIGGKEPAVIAAGIAAQLLLERQKLSLPKGNTDWGPTRVRQSS